MTQPQDAAALAAHLTAKYPDSADQIAAALAQVAPSTAVTTIEADPADICAELHWWGNRPPQVWIAVGRRGVEYHDTTGPAPAPTPCSRSTRTGVILDRGVAVTRYAALPCPRCYSDPVSEANRDEWVR